jgi:hypothetical protein
MKLDLDKLIEQRWSHRRTRFVVPAHAFDPTRFGVEPIPERDAKAFVVEHHYSGSYPAARFRTGLFEKRPFLGKRLVGVAVFSIPAQQAVVPTYSTGHLAPAEGIELGRLVLLDEIGFNAETWFLARSLALLKTAFPEIRLLVSYTDPVPRLTEEGAIVLPGHVGTIYKAFGGRYVGRARARTLWLDASGRVLSERALSKIRTGERGTDYATRLLLAAGAPPRRRGEDPADWVARVLQEGPFRRFAHPGNLVYLWPLHEAVEPFLKPRLPYLGKRDLGL